jgi:hypothetical protein
MAFPYVYSGGTKDAGVVWTRARGETPAWSEMLYGGGTRRFAQGLGAPHVGGPGRVGRLNVGRRVLSLTRKPRRRDVFARGLNSQVVLALYLF